MRPLPDSPHAASALTGGGGSAPTNPTAADALLFLDHANDTIRRLLIGANRASWIQQTYITDDTEELSARATQELIDAIARFANESRQFDALDLSPAARRQLGLLRLSLVMAAPSDPKESEELTRIMAKLDGMYGKARWCADQDDPSSCLNVDRIADVMATSRDEQRLRQVWEGWHTVGAPMRDDYTRFVELANKGARELGFADTGTMWRSKYDMPPDAFAVEVDRLWNQVRPLYLQLHAYVRLKLRDTYGERVPAAGPIPAHLLGNIWAQDWSNVHALVAPTEDDLGSALTNVLKDRQMSAQDMVRIGERFYTSIGFEPLPPTFWHRSLFVRPRDRDVVCHASAWDVDLEGDLRIKMCIEPTAEDLTTIHHELGHNFYDRAYSGQPVLFRDAANDGFHEAIGDTIALSVTPDYLVEIGLLDKAPDPSRDIGLLMSRALEKVSFLPFGLLIDQWRWKVFSGKVPASSYNQAWWDLRLSYQGVAPPSPRGEEHFDPGAKYHVPDNTPYMRYFLARILQFQFHRALSKAAGCTGPLHRCSIYQSREAGARLKTMLSMGLSRPWPDALEGLTGSRQIDATALLEYFAPLSRWLDEQLQGKPVGW